MSDTAEARPELAVEAAMDALPRRRFFSDMPDKGLFAVAAIGGFAGIYFMKTNGFRAPDVALVAVAAMLVYGIVAYRMPLVQMRLDRLGDNFYYLGFIYTLASLAAALLQLSDRVDVQPLLGSFGIALVTTIVGISGRVLLLQLRTGLDDVEQKTRHELVATAEHLRGQLGQSILEFQTFRTALFQVLSETQEAYGNLQRRQVEQAEELTKAVTAQSQRASEANERHARALADAMQTVSGGVETATRRLNAMELPSDRFEKELGTFAANLHALMAALSKTVEEMSRRALTRRRWWKPWRR